MIAPGDGEGAARLATSPPGWSGPATDAGAPSATTRAVDALHRLLYRCAYRLMRCYWALAHPRTHGALVAIWHGERLLLVQNSYVPYRSLPGGYVRRRESGREAAVRELREELGLTVAPGALGLALDLQHRWEGKRERVEIFELEVREPLAPRVDRREVVGAEFRDARGALDLPLFPPIREIVRRRLARPAAGRGPSPAP